MKKLIILFLFMGAIIVGSGAVVLVAPYYYYNKIINQNFVSDWYALVHFDERIKNPGEIIYPDSKNLGNADLWKKFHFMDVEIPLPVKNPFYFVGPVLQFNSEQNKTDFGLKLYGADGRDIAKIFFMPNKFFPNEINSQNLFKLPLVKKQLKSISQDKIWTDIFTKKIEGWNIPFGEMAYNLYLLQLRSRLLPDKFIRFSLVDGTNTASIELESTNKDYTTEILLTNKSGIIYSFVLIWEKGNNESQLIRNKLLQEVVFQGGSHHLASIIYREFKGLNYADQVDHIGMLYLLSAWTHDMSQTEYIKEMIKFLEKGKDNQIQLENLYKYAQSRYGQTFTTKDIEGLEISDELRLQRNVELERQRELEALKNKKEIIKEPELTEEQKLKQALENAKKKKRYRKNRMIID